MKFYSMAVIVNKELNLAFVSGNAEIRAHMSNQERYTSATKKMLSTNSNYNNFAYSLEDFDCQFFFGKTGESVLSDALKYVNEHKYAIKNHRLLAPIKPYNEEGKNQYNPIEFSLNALPIEKERLEAILSET